MQVGAADAGAQHAHLGLTGCRGRLGQVGQRQAGCGLGFEKRPHDGGTLAWASRTPRASSPGKGAIDRSDRDTYGPYVLSREGLCHDLSPPAPSARASPPRSTPRATDVFGVMGNGNAWFLDAVVTSTSHDLHRGPARGRRGRRRRRVLPRVRPARDRDHHLRPRIHERDHAAHRGGAGAHPAGARDRRRARDRARRGTSTSARCTEAAGATYIEVGADDAGDAAEHAVALRARAIARPSCSRSRTTSRAEPATRRVGVGDAHRRRPPPLDAAARSPTPPPVLAAAERPLILAGRGAWLSRAQDAAAALADDARCADRDQRPRDGVLRRATTPSASAAASPPRSRPSWSRRPTSCSCSGPGSTSSPPASATRSRRTPTSSRSMSRSRRRTRAWTRSCAATRREVARRPARGAAGRRAAAVDASPLARGDRAPRPGDALAPDGRLDPRSAIRRIDALLPADRVVVQDGGHFIGWGPTYLTHPGAGPADHGRHGVPDDRARAAERRRRGTRAPGLDDRAVLGRRRRAHGARRPRDRGALGAPRRDA